MIEKLGNQIREQIENTEYTALYVDEYFTVGENGGRKEAILQHKETGELELWASNNSYAGYVIEIDGVGFEFVRSLD